MNIRYITEYLEQLAPLDEAGEYDNVGLLLGRSDKEVTRVLVCLDCTMDAVCEAKENGCELIVCHHPVMFSGVKSITDRTREGEMLLYAIENKIAVYACHTNLDFAQGGLNDYFVEKLGYKACGTLYENEGRVFETGGISPEEFCEKIKKAFGTDMLGVALDFDREILKACVCTGSGKSLLAYAAEKADVYITGDMGHHDILSIKEMGCGYIEMSHYDSEKIVMELLKKRLCEKFDTLEVFTARSNKNPLTNI